MKRWMLSLIVVLGFVVLEPTVLAKKAKPKKGKAAAVAREKASDEGAGAKGKKGKQDLKFSGFKLKGDLKKPDLSYIYKRRGVKNEQIVNIPTDFYDEIRQGENQF